MEIIKIKKYFRAFSFPSCEGGIKAITKAKIIVNIPIILTNQSPNFFNGI